MKVSIRDLRTATKEIFSEINRGNSVIITFRGKDRAKIVPLKEGKKQLQKDDLFGIWKDNKEVKDVRKYLSKLRDG